MQPVKLGCFYKCPEDGRTKVLVQEFNVGQIVQIDQRSQLLGFAHHDLGLGDALRRHGQRIGAGPKHVSLNEGFMNINIP